MSPADASIKDARKPLPEVDGDFYLFSQTLSDEENSVRLKVRAFMEQEVAPIISGYWERTSSPSSCCPRSRR